MIISRFFFFLNVLVPASHTVRRRTVRKSEVREMPSLPRGGGDELVRDEQVSSRRVRLSSLPVPAVVSKQSGCWCRRGKKIIHFSSQRQLEDYLNKLLKMAMYRKYHHTVSNQTICFAQSQNKCLQNVSYLLVLLVKMTNTGVLVTPNRNLKRCVCWQKKLSLWFLNSVVIAFCQKKPFIDTNVASKDWSASWLALAREDFLSNVSNEWKYFREVVRSAKTVKVNHHSRPAGATVSVSVLLFPPESTLLL